MSQYSHENIDSLRHLWPDRPRAPLARHAKILRAPLFKSQSRRNGVSYRVASIKDFPAAGYLPQPSREIRLTDQADRAGRFVLRPYDVLVITVGSIGNVTVVPPDCEDNWIPATNMYVVRPLEQAPALSRALYAIWKSTQGRGLLRSLARGRGIRIVPKKVFSQVEVPVPDDAILAETEALWQREVSLYRDAQQKITEAEQVFDGLGITGTTDRQARSDPPNV